MVYKLIEVIYPNGIKRWFHWINKETGFGYYKKKGKIYRYTIPEEYKKSK